MTSKDNFKEVLEKLGFSDAGDIFTEVFEEADAFLKVDFKNKKLG